MQSMTPPGWYADPQSPQQLRWFDGYQWSGHVAPLPQPDGAHPDSVTHWMLPTGRSWQSITAGYLGLFAIVVVFLGPLSLGFGVWGLAAAKKQGSHGRGRSIFGIVAGVWGTVITALIMLGS